MYRIAVLTNSEAQEAFFTEQVSQFCAECEWFPVIETFRDQEQFFETGTYHLYDWFIFTGTLGKDCS